MYIKPPQNTTVAEKFISLDDSYQYFPGSSISKQGG